MCVFLLNHFSLDQPVLHTQAPRKLSVHHVHQWKNRGRWRTRIMFFRFVSDYVIFLEFFWSIDLFLVWCLFWSIHSAPVWEVDNGWIEEGGGRRVIVVVVVGVRFATHFFIFKIYKQNKNNYSSTFFSYSSFYSYQIVTNILKYYYFY